MKWWFRLGRYPELWVLSGLALLTRLWQIGWPPSLVFDEVYFRTFAGDYLSGSYFFDIHPPLVKLLFAAVGSLFHLTAPQVTSGALGASILRIVPALAGAALVPLIYVILRQLHFSRRIAGLGAAMILFDNALMVESRFVLMDSLLLLFGFGAMSAYFELRKSKGYDRWAWTLVVALLLGAVVSTKWTGLAIVGLIGIAWIVEGILRRWKWQRMVGEAAIVVVTIAGIYIGSFALHFGLLTHSGDGDAFMSEKFQSTLIGSPSYDPNAKVSFWDKFIELNGVMYSAQNTLNNTTHPYASKWYSWPLMIRGVYYWQSDAPDGGVQGHIYLLGNPVVWYLGLFGAVASIVIWLVKPLWLGPRRKLVAFLLLGYTVNFIPFSLIDRPMFLYHYLFAFIISVLLSCVIISRFFEWQTEQYGKTTVTQTYWCIIAAIVICFVFFLPISYGWPLSPNELQLRMLLPTWR